MQAIVDTSVLLATRFVPEMEGELAISAASLAELHFGVLVTADGVIRAERLRRLSDLQRNFDALVVDDGVAVSYGQLAAAVAGTGRQPLLIAGYGPPDRGDSARPRCPPLHPQRGRSRRDRATDRHRCGVGEGGP